MFALITLSVPGTAGTLVEWAASLQQKTEPPGGGTADSIKHIEWRTTENVTQATSYSLITTRA